MYVVSLNVMLQLFLKMYFIKNIFESIGHYEQFHSRKWREKKERVLTESWKKVINLMRR